MKKLVMASLLASMSSSLGAAPSVFVRSDPGMGWWLRAMEGRILGKAVGPVTTEKLSAYLADTMIYSPYRVCALEAAGSDTFVGLDRPTQAEIESSRLHTSWRVTAVTPDERTVVGQSVVFEGCDAEDPRGAALMVTDAVSGEILRWQILGDRYDEEKSFPAWALFLYPRENDELFSYAGCMECGDRTLVYYDVTRKRIYTEHNGH